MNPTADVGGLIRIFIAHFCLRARTLRDTGSGIQSVRTRRHFAEIAWRASVTTRSTVKPKNFNRSFSGAEAPKRVIPIFRPFSPTYRSQPKVAAISTETRAVTSGGNTLFL